MAEKPTAPRRRTRAAADVAEPAAPAAAPAPAPPDKAPAERSAPAPRLEVYDQPPSALDAQPRRGGPPRRGRGRGRRGPNASGFAEPRQPQRMRPDASRSEER